MTANELLNPNLHMTLTIKLSCDNKAWRKNVAEETDGNAEERRKALLDAITEALAPILTSELGKDATAFAEAALDIVDDDKTPIYVYKWRDPLWPEHDEEQECIPIANGEELSYTLRTWYVLDREAVIDREPDYCHPEEGHDEWCIEDKNGEILEADYGSEAACQSRFEELLQELKNETK